MRGIASKKKASLKRHQALFEALEDRTLFTAYTVNTGQPISGTNFHDIQSAVNAVNSSGSTIAVSSGTYAQQVVVSNATDDVGLKITGTGATIQAPASMTSTGALVEIDGVQNVTISGFTIQASTSANFGVAGVYYGVLVDGGTGTSAIISNDTIRNIRLDLADIGDNVGYGVAVTSGTAQITGCSISKYERAGIVVVPVSNPYTANLDGAAAATVPAPIGPSLVSVGPASFMPPSATITSCNISGSQSPTQTIHNGIVFADGAKGSILNTNVSGNANTIGNLACVGVLLEDTGVVVVSQTTINGYSISSNDTNIVIQSDGYNFNEFYGCKNSEIMNVNVQSATYDGVDVLDGATGITINKLTSEFSGYSGIFFSGASSATVSVPAFADSGGNKLENSNIDTNNQQGFGFSDIEDDTNGNTGNPTAGPQYGTANTYTNDTLSDGLIGSDGAASPSNVFGATDFYTPNAS